MVNFEFKIKLIDYWVEDKNDRGYKPMTCYVIADFLGTLKLLEFEVKENE